ncbi:hypothetical protein HY025_00610 [Candidatus Daviesbacteria bacterium]|nr:hypothetical protein [Candidatus Daviesbacteria bacterium]
MSLFDNFAKFLPINKKSSDIEYFFALNIESQSIEGAVWGIEHGKLVVVSASRQNYKEGDLIEVANLCLDLALADFQPEPEKILFGVPDNWLQDDNLKEEHLKKLRNLVKQLDVTPMAYVSTSHAISHLLQKQQGVPITAILVGVAENLDITVVKAGKVVGSRVVKRGNSLPQDLEKGLMTFDEIEVLPSKILLYSSTGALNNSEKIKDEMHSFPWMQNLPFLHLPKVDILRERIAIYATAFAGASEITPDIHLNEQSFEKLDKKIEQQELIPTHKADDLVENLPNLDEPQEPQKHPRSKKQLEDMGFVAGDIENFKEVDSELGLDEEEQVPPEIDERALIREEQVSETFEHQGVKQTGLTAQKMFANLGFPKSRINSLTKFLIILVILLVILALGFIFLPKANVKVFIDPKILEKDAQVTVDPNLTAVDEVNKKIPGKVVSQTLIGTDRGQATGKKEIGDPAKGAVIVYNKTDASKTFSSGTVLVGPDNLQFSLDSSVTVASQSAVEGGITYGKSSVNVTASAVGPDSNLAAGKELTIQGQSSSNFSAKVDSALSGGTSKQVTVVTSDDQKKLLAQATSNLAAKAKDQLQSQLSDGYKILQEALAESNISATYSKRVLDQASDFTINLSITFKGTAYKDADLKTIVSKLVETNVPSGYVLNLADAETQADVAKLNKDGTLVFLAKFKAKLIPDLDKEKIKNQIIGKTPDQAATILKNIENVISSEIKITPLLPGPLKRLPILSQNISISIEAK